MKRPDADKAEVLALLDIIDGDAPSDSKVLAIKRLEHILDRPILNTKQFRGIRDEFANGSQNRSVDGRSDPPGRAETHAEPKTKRGGYPPTGRKGRA